MTANPPPLRAEIRREIASTELQPDERSDLEKLFIPAWLRHDPATDGRNYLGYTMLLLPICLLTMLAIFAVAMLY